jgi:ribosome-associated protein
MKKNTKQNFSSNVSDLKKLVESSLEDGKAKDIVTIPLKGKTDFADYMVIASGTSDKHASSLASNLVKNIKTARILSDVYVEGMAEGNWVLVDTGSIIIHIFKPGVREIYNLEGMWQSPLFEETLATV